MTPRRLWACAILAVAAALPACSRSSPVVPSTVIDGLRISGPTTMAPGSAAQFSAVATHSNGSSEDVTARVQWHSSDTSILAIGATGLATSTIQAGDVNVTATLLQSDPSYLPSSGHSFGPATQSILVVPAGTFRLSGSVRWLGSPIGGAVVQVTAGTGAGLSSAGGPYRLYGVAGDIQLTVSKTDYVTIRQAVTVNSNTVLDFDLVSVKPVPDFGGTYTLRITADPGCATDGAGALPAIGRARQYAATINENGTSLKALLSGANFDKRSTNLLYGQLALDGATFYMNDPMYYYSGVRDLAEVLPDGTVYLASGTINVTRSANDLAGTLSGAITITDSLIAKTVGQCTSTHHSATFTRQSANSSSIRARR